MWNTKTENVSINTVSIQIIDVKVWTQKSEFPWGNFLHSLTQTKITIQRSLELTYILYDQLKDEIARVKCVEYNTDIIINVMNSDDVEDLVNL